MTEGWGKWLQHRKWHYYRDGRSLCGKYAWCDISAPLFPDTPTLSPEVNGDCLACTRKLRES